MSDPQNKITLPKLIAELCPDGVEYKTLGEIGTFYGGLTGKNKDDFRDGNAKYITYMNVYSNFATNLNDYARVKIAENENQHVIKYGDVLFTGSSETSDECGMSSVVTQKPEEKIYLNSFCFGFRLNDVDAFCPDFLKHLFRSNDLRKQIFRTASGVTRYNVSKKRFADVKIPVPPLEVQREIVRILDKFTELISLLEKERIMRKKQYEYYREKLISYSNEGSDSQVQFLKIEDVCKKISSGGTPKTGNSEYYGGNIPWLRTQEVDWVDIHDTAIKITEAGLKNSSAKWIAENCVIVAMYGATAAKVAVNKIPLTTNQACCNLQIDEEKADYRYVFHWLGKEYEKLKSLGRGSQSNINAEIIKQYPIAIPPLSEQKRIAKMLDSFHTLCYDAASGIPAEIAARKKQYEYYRDRLLTFREKIS